MTWDWLPFLAGLGAAVVASLGMWLVLSRRTRRMRDVLENRATRLVELDQLRERLIAITSHEIRGPLTAIIAASEAMRRRGDQLGVEERNRLLEMISQQGNQLARLAEDLMLSSEVEVGLTIKPEMTDLEQAVQRALEAAAPKRRDHQLEVFVEPVRAEIDGYRVSQMLRNLIENAYKYTPDRTRVTVAGRTVDGGLGLEVSDDGAGISPDHREQLFEAFSRMEETTAGREGVGLGLYVVSQLAAAMNARLDLASSSRGTTFTIRIPCGTEPIAHRRMGLISTERSKEA
jgi:signal transduction histidine kinase